MGVSSRQTFAFTVRGPIVRTDLRGLCDRVCALLERNGPGVAVCDVAGVEPDAVTVDALARLQLAARRHGCQVRLCNASDELLRLVEFMGLSDVLPCPPGDLVDRNRTEEHAARAPLARSSDSAGETHASS